MKSVDEYTGRNIRVVFDASRCIHARVCVMGLPEVFRVDGKGPWIVPDNAEAEDLAALIRQCPSGALTYRRTDRDKPEPWPAVNTVKTWENGPLVFHARLQIENGEATSRAVLCRCGASANKPWCDGSHARVGFEATGEPPTRHDKPLDRTDGVVAISLLEDGPILGKGNLEICSGTGRRVDAQQEVALCRCGASRDKPWCDGSHVRVGFKS